MTYYRIGSMNMRFGSKVLERDTIHNINHTPEAIEKLVLLGRISPIKGPPLIMLSEFEEIINELEQLGIVKAEDLLNADHKIVKKIWKRKLVFENIKKDLIVNHLLIPIENRDCNC